ncbi:IS982 family transposase [Mycoavidus sp. HKI]|uniref:IS982 family transposase n=1 Tax=Mycoavidus sp. HKI TaxID=2840467 RepID=UPI001CBFEDCC|nr:IS982 family transposase [Mycoavidus sp. HKI]UAW63663.1 IS982 family transposase [Mycoavidus sp. HKI]
MDNLTELYCLMDDFCKEFEPELNKKLLSSGKRQRLRATSLSLAELMTLVVLFHQIRYRQFKSFYLNHVCQHLREAFPNLPSYNRCIELLPRCNLALAALFETLKGQCTGISIVDSTPIAVCDNLRISRHRVFDGLAARGKSSTGWFFGFKLHAVINHQGELLGLRFTPGNIDDRKPVPDLVHSLFGKLYADKGYISRKLAQSLEDLGVALVTKVRRNMKPIVHTPFDQALFRLRSLVETVFDELKNLCQIEHTRHRSPINFAVNLLSGIIAYCLMPNKPKLPLQHFYQEALNPN